MTGGPPVTGSIMLPPSGIPITGGPPVTGRYIPGPMGEDGPDGAIGEDGEDGPDVVKILEQSSVEAMQYPGCV